MNHAILDREDMVWVLIEYASPDKDVKVVQVRSVEKRSQRTMGGRFVSVRAEGGCRHH